jgi:hypothetical protein
MGLPYHGRNSPAGKIQEKELGENRGRPLMEEGVDDPTHAGSARREDEFLVVIRKSE